MARSIAAEWVTGLDCPKGLALSDDGKWLYAADAGGIVVIDVDAGKIKNKIAIPDTLQLNDLVNDKGTLYSVRLQGQEGLPGEGRQARVYLDEKGAQGTERPVRAQGRAVRARQRQPEPRREGSLAQGAGLGMPGGVDGLENVKGDDFLVSAWGGAIWYVPASGDKQLLFDGKPTETRTADTGWDPATGTLYVPTFFKNTVIAFKVDVVSSAGGAPAALRPVPARGRCRTTARDRPATSTTYSSTPAARRRLPRRVRPRPRPATARVRRRGCGAAGARRSFGEPGGESMPRTLIPLARPSVNCSTVPRPWHAMWCRSNLRNPPALPTPVTGVERPEVAPQAQS
jgi:hypothetical protein